MFGEQDIDNLDWILLRNSQVPVYSDGELLSEHLGELSRSGYRVSEFDCGGRSVRELAYELAGALGQSFDGPGLSLDVLDDVLYDPRLLSAQVPSPGGLVFVLRDFDELANEHPSDADAILHILSEHSRGALMIGLRWIILVTSRHPDFEFRSSRAVVRLNPIELMARANDLIDWDEIMGNFPDQNEDGQSEV